MDPNSGKIHYVSDAEAKLRGYVPVRRKLTSTEILRQQIRLNSRCVCGSEKLFKDCCHKVGGKTMRRRMKANKRAARLQAVAP